MVCFEKVPSFAGPGCVWLKGGLHQLHRWQWSWLVARMVGQCLLSPERVPQTWEPQSRQHRGTQALSSLGVTEAQNPPQPWWVFLLVGSRDPEMLCPLETPQCFLTKVGISHFFFPVGFDQIFFNLQSCYYPSSWLWYHPYTLFFHCGVMKGQISDNLVQSFPRVHRLITSQVIRACLNCKGAFLWMQLQ